MNKLIREKRVQIIASLVEGNSIRSTVRMTGIAKNTVVKLLEEIGSVCAEYQDRTLRNLKCKQIQCDEIWSYCYAKQKNVPKDKQGQFGYGDVWTWTAIDPESKLIISWLVGLRDAEHAKVFMNDLASRLANRVQLTTDGHRAYLEAVEQAFGADIDYAMLVKLYGQENAGEARYGPPACVGCRRQSIVGKPKKQNISTSLIERQNLTMRMGMRRFTRLTNGFSKKVQNLEYAVALHFMYYNFCRIHQTTRITPAMAAGVTDRLWEIEDLIKLLEKSETI
ncbi:MAG: DDE-type integrase/transposase/recombinase [candidate division Zixibacteria bacterium]|nr:DDE-type integrase/transposase/recombinase [candidate division Zixibacteria bacterium]